MTWVREHAAVLLLTLAVVVFGTIIVMQNREHGSSSAPVECSIDGNFANDPPGCVAPRHTTKP